MREHDIDDHALTPNDEGAAGMPGTGENVCPECSGTGVKGSGETCSECAGTGRMSEGRGAG